MEREGRGACACKGRTAKGETIVVGVHPATGMIKTVTPRHDQKGPGSGRAHLAKEIGNALKGEKKMYIENKAALSELEAFIRRNPQVERVKGWIDSPDGVVLVQATHSFFNVSPAKASTPQGLQLIWRGTEPPSGDDCVMMSC